LGEALRIAPGLATATLAEIRIGMRPATPDNLPVLGALPGLSNAYIAAGHGAYGLQLGPYSAALVADQMRGIAPPLDMTPYAPERYSAVG
jgi:D-amino-acid dehydrogenase